MAEKLYNSRSFEYSVLSYQGSPEGKASFTFFADTPVPNEISIGKRISGERICPRTISPHPSNGQNINVPDLIVTDIHSEDVILGELNGTPYRQFKITVDGWLSTKNDSGSTYVVSYTVNAERKDNGDILYTATIETISILNGDNQIQKFCDIGNSVSVPNVSVPLICISYKFNDGLDDFKRYVWTGIYEFSALIPASVELPEETEQNLSYELNGVTVRTIAGELLVLRRSENPIVKKTIVAYSNNTNPIYTPGEACHDGIAMSDKIVEETKEYWDVNSAEFVTSVQYRHEIEVEA